MSVIERIELKIEDCFVMVSDLIDKMFVCDWLLSQNLSEEVYTAGFLHSELIKVLDCTCDVIICANKDLDMLYDECEPKLCSVTVAINRITETINDILPQIERLTGQKGIDFR